MQNFSEKRKPENKAGYDEEAPEKKTIWFKYLGNGPSCKDEDLEDFFDENNGENGTYAIAVDVRDKVTRVAMDTPCSMMVCQALQKLLHGENVKGVPEMPETLARDMLEMFRKALAGDFNEKFHTYFRE